MRQIAQTLIVLIGGTAIIWCFIWAAGSRPVSNSVRSMGQRAGMVIPQGSDEGSKLLQDQPVRVMNTPVQSPARPPASKRAEIHSQLAQIKRDELLYPTWAALLVGMCMFFTVITVIVLRPRLLSSPMSHQLPRTALGLVVVGVFAGVGFAVTRSFWTGVDDSFIERATVMTSDSLSKHVLAERTLSMNTRELYMLYSAIALTSLPVMMMIALAQIRITPTEQRLPKPSRIRPKIDAAKLAMRPVIRPIRLSFTVAYVLLMIYMWSAPWSTTMVNEFFGA